MKYISRKISSHILHALERGKSVLLLGPRQTGKSTLIEKQIKPDLSYSFLQPGIRNRYEQNPSLLTQEIEAEIKIRKLNNPIIVIDEVQKIPLIMDVVQDLIDRHIARFILTGSSARKLKHGLNVNLLPGRVVLYHLDPLSLSELPEQFINLEQLLTYGSLPGILAVDSVQDRELDLKTYVHTYLDQEVRAEALVRNMGSFTQFLFLAASESGNLINFSQLSQTIGVAHTTIASYYQILEDCLIAEKIEPIPEGKIRKRLSKAPKYLFFDLGVRRQSAEEGISLPISILSHLFEQFVGLELIRHTRLKANLTKICYWRSHDGPEVDFVIQENNQYTPIEVKWTDRPTAKDFQHLKTFLEEYPDSEMAYLICRTPKPLLFEKKIMALPWQDIPKVMVSTR